MKFRKRPVVIEAVEWHPEYAPDADVVWDADKKVWGIVTLEGFMIASAGDLIITGVKGERYPCKPDIFAATYEPVEAKPEPAALDKESTKP